MNHSRTIAVTAIIVVLIAIVTWQFAAGVWASIQLSFAVEQTEVISEMVEKASEALRREPPDVKAAVGFLEYAHRYYPSGTKQTVGSRLDRIVERSRSNAERQIIEMLRVATDTDLGPDPEAWVREFGNQAVSDR